MRVQMGWVSLHVEYAERGREYGILFIISLFREWTHLEYVRIPVTYRVNQAEYGISILVVVPQEYVNTYSTRRWVSSERRMFVPSSICTFWYL